MEIPEKSRFKNDFRLNAAELRQKTAVPKLNGDDGAVQAMVEKPKETYKAKASP